MRQDAAGRPLTIDKPIADLLHRACGGDGNALQELLCQCRPYIHLLVRSRTARPLRGRVDSSDMVQETQLRAARHIHQFQGRTEAEWLAWLARIAEREVVRQLRQHLGAQKRAVGREQPLVNAVDSQDGLSRLEAWGQAQSSPSQAMLRDERALQLARALAGLPDDYREVLVLRHVEGLPFADVAARLGRSEGAARVLWTRALKRLRDALHAEEESHGAS